MNGRCGGIRAGCDPFAACGWCTAWKAWSNKQPEQKKTVDLAAMSKEDLENLKKDEGFYEINICAEHLARPFEQVAETLLHEMVHLYNLQIGVQDTSRGGTYHNKKYKEAAEQHGLTVGKDAKYGWTVTTLNDEAKAFVLQPGDLFLMPIDIIDCLN